MYALLYEVVSVCYYLLCVDIDECSGFHGCSHMCQNLNGTYECLCEAGYIIQADERQCQGICTEKLLRMYIVFSY